MHRKILPEPNHLDEKSVKSMNSRIIVSFILIAILIPTISLGSWLFLAVIGIFLLISIQELVTAPRKSFRPWVMVLAYLSIVLMVYWFLVRGNVAAYLDFPDTYSFSLENYFSGIHVSIIVVILMVFLYFLGAIADENFNMSDLGYMVSMSLVLGLGFQSIYFIRYFPFYSFMIDSNYSGQILVFDTVGSDLSDNPLFTYGLSSALFYWVAFGVVMNDTFAYFIGSLYGKHRMNPRVSPKKSWEGFFGGVIGSFVLNCFIGLMMAGFGYPILPFLDLSHWYWIIIIAALIPLLGDLGDLSFSLIKRHYDIKDYGTLLKSHGGILDRADSVTFTCAGLSILLMFISSPWSALLG